jgi:transcriptional regulator with PAS, ATPase and Fis domain
MSKELMNIIEKIKPILSATSVAICVMDKDNHKIYENPLYEIMTKRKHTEIVSDVKDIYHNGTKIGCVVVYHDISEINRLRRELDRLNQKLRKVETKLTFKDIIGKNQSLQKVINTAKVAAATPATILIRGESGTGKEIFANAIHNASQRRNETFVKINCASFPEELIESELFGYKEGAFTGAQRGGKRGLFQEADRGTLFMDEIGDVSPRMQVKLLRALQEKEIMPVGSIESIPVDVRIICATNKPLERMIEGGNFREDLYYRLNVFPLKIPPLRERKEDVEEISMYLINKYNEIYDRNVKQIEAEAIELLKENQWTGNVRELENVLARALINQDDREEVLMAEDVMIALGGEEIKKEHKKKKIEEMPLDINIAIEITERSCIQRALIESNGDKNKATVLLGIPLRTLYYKCKKLNI